MTTNPPGAGGSLDNIREYCVPQEGDEAENRKAARRKRYFLRYMARKLLPKERVSKCGKVLRVGGHAVKQIYNKSKPKGARLRHDGLITCGSVWVCPVCSAKIAEKRRQEILQACAKYPNFFMVTFTIQHNNLQSLKYLMALLKDAMRHLKRGRWWMAFAKRWQIIASVKKAEATYGHATGWHFHFHVLFFSTAPTEAIDVDKIKSELVNNYAYIVSNLGGYVHPDAVHIRKGDQGAADYFAKELAYGDAKEARESGRYAPWQLVELYSQGEKWAGAKFIEYAESTKRTNQLTWSRNARQVLGLGFERTDLQIAEADESDFVDVDFGLVRYDSWKHLYKLVPDESAHSQILSIGDDGDPKAVRNYLHQFGVPYFIPDEDDRGPRGEWEFEASHRRS